MCPFFWVFLILCEGTPHLPFVFPVVKVGGWGREFTGREWRNETFVEYSIGIRGT